MSPNSVHIFVCFMVILMSYQLYRCLEKYNEFETIEKRRIIEMESNNFPMVSVRTVPGYKVTKPESFFNVVGSIKDYCFLENTDESTNYTACLEDLTFQPWEMVEAVLYNDDILSFDDVVVTPYTPLLIPYGRTFTFNYNEGQVTGQGQRLTFKIRNMANFTVSPSLTFQFHVNGTYFPYVYLDADNFDQRAEQIFFASTNNHGIASLLLRRHYRMNTPKNPCIEEEDYTVLKCLEKFIAEGIGCVSPWTNIETSIKTCQSKEEMDSLVQWQTRLFSMSASDFTSLTGCFQPCIKDEVEMIKYTEIKFPYFQDGANSFVIMLVSTSMIEIRETLLYDINSMVGEIGGSLGLFLGMSLVHLYKEGMRMGKKLMAKTKKGEKPSGNN